VSLRQRILRLGGVVVSARCGEPCRLSASGALLLSRTERPRLWRTPIRLRAGQRVRLKIRLTSAARRRLAKRIASGRAVTARVSLRARDPMGNLTVVRRLVRSKR
jgi:hypothetical protein